MNNENANLSWEALQTERAEARKAVVFACLGSNRVPDSLSSHEDADAVGERIAYIVSQSM